MIPGATKRQQARNEKALQDLVHSTPGNGVCADCGHANPSWASWSLGIFLCMRCAAIHRKLGTHVSKVKSLSMDSWSNEQVENMRKVGNLTSNKLYNPKGKKPPIPIDADEADSAMERFIRSKYTTAVVPSARRHRTGSTESDETPPPLPPKTPSRFGFRSASSIFPLSSRAKREAASREPPSPHDASHRSPASPRRNKASKVFGASLDYDDGSDDKDRKLAQLRDMGFNDDQRNAMVLKGVNGNLELAVESLVRLGEGGARSPLSLTSPRGSSLSATRSLTPATTTSNTSGLSLPPKQRSTTPSNSTNPFDMLDMPAAQPQSSQSTGTLQTNNPFLYNSTNPFGVPGPQVNSAFTQSFQNLSVAPPQSLFPHHTGGIPAPQPMHQPQPPYQQSMTPPVPSMTQNYASMGFNSHQTYPQVAPPLQNYNPFLNVQQPAQPAPSQAPLLVDTSSLGQFGSNPFTRSPTRIQSPVLSQIPEQSQQNNFYPQAPQAQLWNQVQSHYTHENLQQPQPQPQQQHQQTQPPAHVNNPFFSQNGGLPQQQPFAPPRADTASIMALYNMPQLAPRPQMPAQPETGFDAGLFGQSAQSVPPALAPTPEQSRSVSAPPAGSKNPFLNGGGMASPTSPAAHKSRDSMMALGMEWSNGGRHSPDAFASLSARH